MYVEFVSLSGKIFHHFVGLSVKLSVRFCFPCDLQLAFRKSLTSPNVPFPLPHPQPRAKLWSGISLSLFLSGRGRKKSFSSELGCYVNSTLFSVSLWCSIGCLGRTSPLKTRKWSSPIHSIAVKRNLIGSLNLNGLYYYTSIIWFLHRTVVGGPSFVAFCIKWLSSVWARLYSDVKSKSITFDAWPFCFWFWFHDLLFCVVPENIHTSHWVQRKFWGEGSGCPKACNFQGGGGWPLESFFGGSGKIDEKAISYFTVNRGVKANIIVFHRWSFICARLSAFFYLRLAR